MYVSSKSGQNLIVKFYHINFLFNVENHLNFPISAISGNFGESVPFTGYSGPLLNERATLKKKIAHSDEPMV